MAIIHQQAVMRAESGVDLRKCEGCFVKKDTSGKLVLCDKSDIPLGVVHVGGDEGEDTDYLLPAHQGIVGVRLSESPGSVEEGTRLVLDDGGTAKAGDTGTLVAVACEPGTGGQLLESYLTLPTVLASSAGD
ncbi:hypothetical protein [Akkermansia muciniphila]|jgi:hypothetical protein|uniref:hypothetical protein n=1 Tax=Akkermansia muciniphila TaxID=239935 RepID=UPI00201E3AE1|nr:hypothetical protein [Akkermansia muciniphila]MCL6680955.1 hypothetical protein [Akkermansia muciniphila]WMB14779.1 hypothetical protein O4G22_08820 [Akkermansia muciniphila]WMB19263.1 hypothetical protein O4G19_09080 [Akkermansia muciniphila]